MRLDHRTIWLIAVGASITANCQPCLEMNFAKALENGADEQDIVEAIEIGKMVRKGAWSKMDRVASGLSQAVRSSTAGTDGECECALFAGRSTGGNHGEHT
jgi:AhpD family alkylhydroperoxidase